MIKKRFYNVFFIIGILIVSMGIVAVALSKKDEGKWETLKDFSGTMTIKRNVEFESIQPDSNPQDSTTEAMRHVAKDNSYAMILVKGTVQAGPYTRTIGTWSGSINFEWQLIGLSSGAGVKESFSGEINREFDAECAICGPSIKVNKKKHLYRISVLCPKGEGELSQWLVPGGVKNSRISKAEICPHIPDLYRIGAGQGAFYDPSSNIITGNYSITCYGNSREDGSMAVMNENDPILQSMPEYVKWPIQYTVSWNFRINKPDYRVKIIVPDPGTKVIFFDYPPGLFLWAQARATPEIYNDEIQPWLMDPIKGSDVTTKPSPPVGPDVLFSATKLPRDNDQFGKKKIYADNADPVEIEVFFNKYGKDNPGEYGNPNWFYYWKQDVVPFMDVFEYDSTIDYYGYFCPSSGRLALGDLAAETDEFEMLSLYTPKGLVVYFFPETEGVDTCARTVKHELKHKEIHDTFNAKIIAANAHTPAGYWCDFDFDGIPDEIEKVMRPELGIKYWEADTHRLGKKLAKEYKNYGDQELLCWLAEQGATGIHEKDWAFPGKQSGSKK